ncbi:MAG: TrkA family potassium uptake protein [Candidatus Sericytochromatia bacterium]|nr:TrkA family potassium uptake protein [Candidatus Sericytochromatia bacterium]
MYIVIAGGGLMGLSLAEALVAHRHDVLVIDPEPAVTEYAHTEIGAMVHTGSATDPRVLEAVGMRRADIAVAVMRNDALNLAFILLAKSFGVPRRLVRMREKDFEEAYRLAGATTIVSSVKPLIDQMMVNIEYPDIRSLMRFNKGNIDVFEVTVPPQADVAGLTVEAIARLPDFPPTCNFVAVENAYGTLEIARGTTEVPGGSTAILLAMEVDLDAVIRLLTRPRGGA